MPGKSLSKKDNDRLRGALADIVKQFGTQTKAAEAMGVSQGMVSDMLQEGRGAGPKLVRAIGRFRPEAVHAVFGIPPPATAGSPRDEAIRLIVADSDDDLETIREAALRLGERPSWTVLEWVRRIELEMVHGTGGGSYKGVNAASDEVPIVRPRPRKQRV